MLRPCGLRRLLQNLPKPRGQLQFLHHGELHARSHGVPIGVPDNLALDRDSVRNAHGIAIGGSNAHADLGADLLADRVPIVRLEVCAG